MKETRQLKKEMHFCQQLKILGLASRTRTGFQNHLLPKPTRNEVSKANYCLVKKHMIACTAVTDFSKIYGSIKIRTFNYYARRNHVCIQGWCPYLRPYYYINTHTLKMHWSPLLYYSLIVQSKLFQRKQSLFDVKKCRLFLKLDCLTANLMYVFWFLCIQF